MVSDAIWKELCEVSLSLGHIDEARRCATQVRNDAIRMVLESRLARRTAGRRGNFDEHGHFRPAGAPAASDAGPSNAELPPQSNRILDEAEEETGFGGHLVDAAHFLMHQHMPWLCLLTMLAFPVVIGLGGFLTAGTSTIALAAISALPGLCVCAIIFAMGRRILLESS
ncbi:MAG: hypothetical protein KDE27_10720, partial [Planctomycetes bacterium]|nr:hypothetical protein [Planctomycetota bacterium]